MARSSFLAAILLAAFPLIAQVPSETDRLVGAARLWVTVEYFHPYLVAGKIDWDQALIDALPKIRAANDAAAYRAAISGMLDQLHDPETHVLSQGEEPKPSTAVSSQAYVIRTATETAFLSKSAPLETVLVELPWICAAVRLNTGSTSGSAYAIPATFLETPTPTIHSSSSQYSEPYPAVEARLLAAIKTWGAIHYFFAYKDLVDEDWDDVFAKYLPKFIAAKDALEYNLTFADLLTHLTDTNTAPHSKVLDEYFGEVSVGLRLRLLDKYPIITDVFDSAAREAGVRPGDVLKRIANENITDRFHRFVQYVPASTPQRSGFDTIQRVTNGPAGSTVALTIEDEKGEAHLVTLTRTVEPPTPQRTAEIVRVLPGNVGYLDLDRLKPSDTDEAFNRLRDTKAIILDLRGNAPAGFDVASHLTSDPTGAVALITTPIALHPDIASSGIATQTANTFVVKTLPKPRPPAYKGKTVALIDERTIGESEYAGLLFEAASKTEFIGTASAGTESRVAELALPGGITVTYSTEDVRHANGGKLQRLGFQPNVSSYTTAKGLHAGKDEVLDAAIAYLNPSQQQLAYAKSVK